MNGLQFELVNVSKSYGEVVALADVSFSLSAGEHTAILGSSGSGKSTVLRLLAGLETPSSGRLLLDAREISTPDRLLMPPHRRGVALVFQDLALWPNLSVRENVRLGLSGTSITARQSAERVHETLALCGIEALAGRLPGQLSGGQQQRVALARAIALRPRFLLLDEPFSGIDMVTKSRLLDEIGCIATRQDLTVVLVSHDPWEATVLCRRAIVFEHGRLQEQGPLHDLVQTPKSEILRMFRDHLRGWSNTGDKPSKLLKTEIEP
jgi:ABC-type Fe3+/spermidine/putrescine transport system ATPase subunit